MRGLCSFGLAVATAIAWGTSVRGGDVVNGYTYIAPSVYPAPPIVLYDPAMVIPTQTVIYPLNYTPPAQVVYAQPAYLSTPMMPFNPNWAYAPLYYGPNAVRSKAWVSGNGPEYRYREYAPGRLLPVYSYRYDSEGNGVRIRERIR